MPGALHKSTRVFNLVWLPLFAACVAALTAGASLAATPAVIDQDAAELVYDA